MEEAREVEEIVMVAEVKEDRRKREIKLAKKIGADEEVKCDKHHHYANDYKSDKCYNYGKVGYFV